MGGRGASSGTSKAGNAYGTQYNPLMTVGNVKFVTKVDRNSETLMETMTRGRVYALVDRGNVKSIVYFDNENKRTKQIDLKEHNGNAPHVHRGYLHNEYTVSGEPTKLTTKERDTVDMVITAWDNRESKQ